MSLHSIAEIAEHLSVSCCVYRKQMLKSLGYNTHHASSCITLVLECSVPIYTRSTRAFIQRGTVSWRTHMTNRGTSSLQSYSHTSLSDLSKYTCTYNVRIVYTCGLTINYRQRVSCLGSEIGFISEFAGSVLHTVEYGYLLTELKVTRGP